MERITRVRVQKHGSHQAIGLPAIYNPVIYRRGSGWPTMRCCEVRAMSVVGTSYPSDSWDSFFQLLKETPFPDDFLCPEDRNQPIVNQPIVNKPPYMRGV